MIGYSCRKRTEFSLDEMRLKERVWVTQGVGVQSVKLAGYLDYKHVQLMIMYIYLY